MPVIPLDVSLSVGEVTDPVVRPGGHWVSGVQVSGVTDAVTSVLRMWSVGSGAPVELLSEPVPSAGRGASGGVHTWHHDGRRLFVVTRADGVVEVEVDGDRPVRVRRTALNGARSWSTPSVGVDGRSLYAVADWSEMWCMSLDDGSVSIVASVDDGFLLDADGPSRRCHVWRRPHMPWTQSAIIGIDEDPGVAVQQPRSTRDGATRGWITDIGGVANVLIEPDAHCGEWTRIVDDCEHAGPVWGPGQRTWCPSPDGRRIAYTRNEQGFGSLWVFDRTTGERTMLGRGVHGCLSWEGDTLAAHRSGARTPPQIVVHDMSRSTAPTRSVLVDASDPRWKSDGISIHQVEPVMHRAPSPEGHEVPYRLFRAIEPHGGVIVWIHGGPIDQWQVTFRPRQVHWLSRGWSIAVVDHRGTTGWGRAHALALEGLWGDADARDTVAVIDHLVAELGVDPSSLVLMGASAGGLTALNAARLVPHAVAGAVLSYPVVDLGDLLTGDDPFETHYMPRLIGASTADSDVVGTRSPHLNATGLASVPLLVFHGDADASVPLRHSERLRDAVVAAGGSCRLLVFEGEGHGFRSRRNVEREFVETEMFLASIIR